MVREILLSSMNYLFCAKKGGGGGCQAEVSFQSPPVRSRVACCPPRAVGCPRGDDEISAAGSGSLSSTHFEQQARHSLTATPQPLGGADVEERQELSSGEIPVAVEFP